MLQSPGIADKSVDYKNAKDVGNSSLLILNSGLRIASILR